jgi:hypothetical protein
MKYTNATKFHRKSGVAQWRDLQCALRVSQILEYSRRLFSPCAFFQWKFVRTLRWQGLKPLSLLVYGTTKVVP